MSEDYYSPITKEDIAFSLTGSAVRGFDFQDRTSDRFQESEALGCNAAVTGVLDHAYRSVTAWVRDQPEKSSPQKEPNAKEVCELIQKYINNEAVASIDSIESSPIDAVLMALGASVGDSDKDKDKLDQLQDLVSRADSDSVNKLLCLASEQGSAFTFLSLLWSLLYRCRASSVPLELVGTTAESICRLSRWAVPGIEFVRELQAYDLEQRRLKYFIQEPYLQPLHSPDSALNVQVKGTLFFGGQVPEHHACAAVSTGADYFEIVPQMEAADIKGIRFGFMLSSNLTEHFDSDEMDGTENDKVWLLDVDLKCLLQSPVPKFLLVPPVSACATTNAEPVVEVRRKLEIPEGVNDKYLPFFKMRKVGVPEVAIRLNMTQAELGSDADFAVVFADQSAASTDSTVVSSSADASGDSDGDFFGSLFVDAERKEIIEAQNREASEAERAHTISSLNGTPITDQSVTWSLMTTFGCRWSSDENKISFFADGALVGSIENVLDASARQQLVSVPPDYSSSTMLPGSSLSGGKMWPVVRTGESSRVVVKTKPSEFEYLKASVVDTSGDSKSLAEELPQIIQRSQNGIRMPCLRLLNGPVYSNGASDAGVIVDLTGGPPMVSFSLSAYVRLLPNSGISDSTGQIIVSFCPPGDIGWVCFSIFPSGVLCLETSAGTFETQAVRGANSFEGEAVCQLFNPFVWQYVAVSYNGETKEVMFYVDSSDLNSTIRLNSSNTGCVDCEHTLCIGCDLPGRSDAAELPPRFAHSALCGDICDVRLWSIPLSSSVLQTYKTRGSASLKSKVLVGNWKLSEGCGQLVYNSAVLSFYNVEEVKSSLPEPPHESATPPPAPLNYADAVKNSSAKESSAPDEESPHLEVVERKTHRSVKGSLVGSWYWVDALGSSIVIPSSRQSTLSGAETWHIGTDEDQLNFWNSFIVKKSVEVFPFLATSSVRDIDGTTPDGDKILAPDCASTLCKYLYMSGINHLQRKEHAELVSVQSVLKSDFRLLQHPSTAIGLITKMFESISIWLAQTDFSDYDSAFGYVLFEAVSTLIILVRSLLLQAGSVVIRTESVDPQLRAMYSQLFISLLPFVHLTAEKLESQRSLDFATLSQSISVSVIETIRDGFHWFFPTPRSRLSVIQALLIQKHRIDEPKRVCQHPLLPSSVAACLVGDVSLSVADLDPDMAITLSILTHLSVAASGGLLDALLDSQFVSCKSIVEAFISGETFSAVTRRYLSAFESSSKNQDKESDTPRDSTKPAVRFPRAAVGDFVILREAKGNAEDPAITGFVVDITEWEGQPGCGILVLWPDGSLQTYCYGGVTANAASKPRYDVKIVLAKFRESGGSMQYTLQTPTLRYSPEEVEACLCSDLSVDCRIGYSDVLRCLRNCCPRPLGIVSGIYAANASAISPADLSQVYKSVYETVTSAGVRYFPDADDSELLMDLLMTDCAMHKGNLGLATSSLRLLLTLQAFLSGALDDSQWESQSGVMMDVSFLQGSAGAAVSASEDDSLLTPALSDLKWDWATGLWSICEASTSQDVEAPPSAVKKSAVPEAITSTPLTFVDSGTGLYIFQDDRRRKGSITRHQKWHAAEMCVMDAILAPYSGVYNWVVNIEKYKNNDHLLVGVVNAQSKDMSVVGSDAWFLNRDGVIIRKGSPQFSEQRESCSFSGGQALHFSYDSHTGALSILISLKKSRRSREGKNSVEEKTAGVVVTIPEGLVITPCVCMFSRGDLLSISWEDYLGDEVWAAATKSSTTEQSKSSSGGEAMKSPQRQNSKIKSSVSNSTITVPTITSRTPFASPKSLGKSIMSSIVAQGNMSMKSVSCKEAPLMNVRGCPPAAFVTYCSIMLRCGIESINKAAGSDILMISPLFSIFLPGALASLSLWQYSAVNSRNAMSDLLLTFLFQLRKYMTPRSLSQSAGAEVSRSVKLGNQLVVVTVAALGRLLSDAIAGDGILNSNDLSRRGSVFTKDCMEQERYLNNIFTESFPTLKYFPDFTDFNAFVDVTKPKSAEGDQGALIFDGVLVPSQFPTMTYLNIRLSTDTDFNDCEQLFSEWLMKRDGILPTVRKIGGDNLKCALWRIFYAVLHHSGSLSAVNTLFGLLKQVCDDKEKANAFFDQVTPPKFLVEAWRGANQCRMWAVRLSQSNKDTADDIYDQLCAVINFKASFLTMFESKAEGVSFSGPDDALKFCEALSEDDKYLDSVISVITPIVSFIKYYNKPLSEMWSLCKVKQHAMEVRCNAFRVLSELLNGCESIDISSLNWPCKSILATIFSDGIGKNYSKHHNNISFRYIESSTEVFARKLSSNFESFSSLDTMSFLQSQFANSCYLGVTVDGVSASTRQKLQNSVNDMFLTLCSELTNWSPGGDSEAYAILLINSMFMSIPVKDLDILRKSNVLSLLGRLISDCVDKNSITKSPDTTLSISLVRSALKLYSSLILQLVSASNELTSDLRSVLITSFDFIRCTLDKILKDVTSNSEVAEKKDGTNDKTSLGCGNLSNSASVALAEMSLCLLLVSGVENATTEFLCSADWIALLLEYTSVTILTAQQRVFRILQNILHSLPSKDLSGYPVSSLNHLQLKDVTDDFKENRDNSGYADAIVGALFAQVGRYAPLSTLEKKKEKRLKSNSYTSSRVATDLSEIGRSKLNSLCCHDSDGLDYYQANCCIMESVALLRHLYSTNSLWRLSMDRALESGLSSFSPASSVAIDMTVLVCLRVLGGFSPGIYPCTVVNMPVIDASGSNCDTRVDALDNFGSVSSSSTANHGIGKIGVIISMQDKAQSLIVFCPEMPSDMSNYCSVPAQSVSPQSKPDRNPVRWGHGLFMSLLNCLEKLLKMKGAKSSTADVEKVIGGGTELAGDNQFTQLHLFVLYAALSAVRNICCEKSFADLLLNICVGEEHKEMLMSLFELAIEDSHCHGLIDIPVLEDYLNSLVSTSSASETSSTDLSIKSSVVELPVDSKGHQMPFTSHTPGPHNPLGYQSGWVCDKCRSRSKNMSAEVAAGRYHCADCNSDICINCSASSTHNAVLLDAAGHHMSYTPYSSGPHNSLGYALGWVCDRCCGQSMQMPPTVSCGRYHCSKCQADVCLECAKIEETTQNMTKNRQNVPFGLSGGASPSWTESAISAEQWEICDAPNANEWGGKLVAVEGQQFSTESLFNPSGLIQSTEQAQRNDSNPPDESSVEVLMSMGFSREACISSLLACENDIEAAINHLLSGGGDENEDDPEGDVDDGEEEEDVSTRFEGFGDAPQTPRPETNHSSRQGRGGRGPSQQAGRGRGRGRSESQLCFAFHRGECTRGDNCKFVHDNEDNERHPFGGAGDSPPSCSEEENEWGATAEESQKTEWFDRLGEPDNGCFALSNADQEEVMASITDEAGTSATAGIEPLSLQYADRAVLFVYETSDLDSERICYLLPGDEVIPLQVRVFGDERWVKIHARMRDEEAAGATPNFSVVSFGWIMAISPIGCFLTPTRPEQGSYDDDIRGKRYPRKAVYEALASLPLMSKEGGELVAEVSKGGRLNCYEESLHASGLLSLHVATLDGVVGWVLKYPGSLRLIEGSSEESSRNSTEVSSPQKDHTAHVKSDCVLTTEVAEEAKNDDVEIPIDKIETEEQRLSYEIQLFEKIEDDMESLTGSSVYSKEDRLFGSLQGCKIPTSPTNETDINGTLSARRTKICGGYLNRYNVSKMNDVAQRSKKTLTSLAILNSRQIILALLLRTFALKREHASKVDAKDRHDILKSLLLGCYSASTISNEHALENIWDEFAKKFGSFLRLVMFRGLPLSSNAVESLAVLQHEAIGLKSSVWSTELVLGATISRLWAVQSEGEVPNTSGLKRSMASTLLLMLSQQLRLACSPSYTDFNFTTATYWNHQDSDLPGLPNTSLAVWLSRTLLSSLQWKDESFSQDIFTCQHLLKLWCLVLRSSSMSLQFIGFTELAKILSNLMNVSLHVAETKSKVVEIVHYFLEFFPAERLMIMGQKRLLNELEDDPAYSRYLDSLLDLLSQYQLLLVYLSNEKHEERSQNTENNKTIENSMSMQYVNTFNSDDSRIDLQPERDVNGAWTVEFWIYRQHTVKAVHSTSSNAMSKDSPLLTVGESKQEGRFREAKESVNISVDSSANDGPFDAKPDDGSAINNLGDEALPLLDAMSRTMDPTASEAQGPPVSQRSASWAHSSSNALAGIYRAAEAARREAAIAALSEDVDDLDLSSPPMDLDVVPLAAPILSRARTTESLNRAGNSDLRDEARHSMQLSRSNRFSNLVHNILRSQREGQGTMDMLKATASIVEGLFKDKPELSRPPRSTTSSASAIDCLPSEYILHSPNAFVRLQRGGVYQRPDIEDPLQVEDFVHDASLCMSICCRGEARDTVLDLVIPHNEWTHVALSYHGVNVKVLDAFVNGKLADSLNNVKMVLPLSTIGYSSNGMSPPSAEIGNPLGTEHHKSFHGHLHELRVWCTAKTEGEVVRDMYRDVTGMKDLLGLLRRPDGSAGGTITNSALIEDRTSYWTSCSLAECVITADVLSPQMTPPFPEHLNFIGYDDEEAEGIFGEEIGISCSVVSWTGVLKLPPRNNYYTDTLTKSSSPSKLRRGGSASPSDQSSPKGEVINICYKKFENSTIEGYLEWCSYGTRSQLSGTVIRVGENEEALSFHIEKGRTAVVGPSEDISWIDAIDFNGTVMNNGDDLKGDFTVTSLDYTLPELLPGQMRIDRDVLGNAGSAVNLSIQPVPLKLSEDGTEVSKMMETLVVTGDISPKAVFSVVVNPFEELQYQSVDFPVLFDNESNLEQISSDGVMRVGQRMKDAYQAVLTEIEETVESCPDASDVENKTCKSFGLRSGSGIYHLTWIVRANPGKSIIFGVCTSAAIDNGDKMLKNSDSWTYSSDGRITHGRSCVSIGKFDQGDTISIEINTFHSGSVSFFKNGERVFEFFDLNKHAAMCQDKSENFSKKAETLGVRPFCFLGQQRGTSVSFLQTQPPLRQPCSNNHLVKIPMPGDDNLGRKALSGSVSFGSLFGPGCLLFHRSNGYWRTFWWLGLQHGVQLWAITGGSYSAQKSDKDVTRESKKKFDLILSQTAATFQSDSLVSTLDLVKDIEVLAVRAFLFDRGVCVRELTETEAGPYMAEFTKELQFARDSVDSTSKLEIEAGELGPSSIEKAEAGGTSPMRALSAAVAKMAQPVVSKLFGQLSGAQIKELKLTTKAPLVLKIIYENGATVRDGVDIDNSTVVTSLSKGDVVEAFEKGVTPDGIGRYRIHNGWISERLRGGKEESVVEILQYIPAKPMLYRVLRSDGAKVRRDISMTSPELGIISKDTILEIVRAEILEDVEEGGDRCTRLLIKKPSQWKGGWISDKKHIVSRVDAERDRDTENELKRRVLVRANRARRLESKNSALDRAASLGLVQTTVSQTIAFIASYETFFLLGGYGLRRSGRQQSNSSDSVTLSEDFATATMSGNRGQSRTLTLGTRGFQRGIHYWEVQVESAQWGSVFIGVAPQDATGWNGYGFLNYRAIQSFGKETIYGSYYSANDTIGVLLDMDHGTITFFKDVEDYSLGKVIAMDLGVAFHNLRRNNKAVAPYLFPCFGMANSGDSLSIRKSRWVSRRGLGKAALLSETLRARTFMSAWNSGYNLSVQFSESLQRDLYLAYLRWHRQGTLEVLSRAGIPIYLDVSQEALNQAAGAELCEVFMLRVGLRLSTRYGDSKILGCRRGQIWYSVLGDGGGAWYWTQDQLTNLFQASEVSVAEHGNDFDKLSTTAATVSAVDEKTDEVESEAKNDEIKISAAITGKDDVATRLLGEDEFVALLLGSENEGGSWTRDEDAALAALVNEISVHLEMDPLRIPAEILVAYRRGVRSSSGSPRGMLSEPIIPHYEQHQNNFFESGGLGRLSVLSRRSLVSLQARYAALCVLNKAAHISLPSTDLSSDPVLSSLVTTSYDIDFMDKALKSWTGVSKNDMSGLYSSLSGRVFSNLKPLIYTRVKLDVWNRTLKETVTFTPPPADEYERPDDIREIPLNRMEALAVKNVKDKTKFPEVFKKSLFGQLYNKLHNWDDRLLRRSYVHKENAGQARAFFVSFTGEGVVDHSGPYRAAFEVALGDEPNNLLELLVPTPNAKSEIGDKRDLVIFNDGITGTDKGIWQYNFLGKLIGVACRHKIMIPMSVPPLYWKSLCRVPLVSTDLQAVDEHLVNTLRMIKTMTDLDSSDACIDNSTTTELVEMFHQLLKSAGVAVPDGPNFLSSIMKLGGTDNHSETQLCGAVVKNLCSLIEQKSLTAHTRGLYEFYRGLSTVLPTEVFSIFTEEELSDLICGRPEVDIAQLRRSTEYEEISPNDSHVGYFWEALEMMSDEEMSGFINFCSGRSRLPQNSAEKANLKLTGPPPQSSENPDNYLPIAQTCFFSVSLPKYTSAQKCLEKLRYAIENAHSMDADFVMRNANGWENIN